MRFAVRPTLTLTMLLAFASSVEAQGKPVLKDTVRFQTLAFLAKGTDRETPDLIQTTFQDSIPSGKRLVVQHVSVNFFGTGITEPVVGANCAIQALASAGGGSFDFVQHFIPLSIQQNVVRKVASYTGGQSMTAFMDAGATEAIEIRCRAGAQTGEGTAVQLTAQLTGLLITK